MSGEESAVHFIASVAPSQPCARRRSESPLSSSSARFVAPLPSPHHALAPYELVYDLYDEITRNVDAHGAIASTERGLGELGRLLLLHEVLRRQQDDRYARLGSGHKVRTRVSAVLLLLTRLHRSCYGYGPAST